MKLRVTCFLPEKSTLVKIRLDKVIPKAFAIFVEDFRSLEL